MPRLEPVELANAPDNIAKLYGRVQEMLGEDDIPAPFLVYGNVEAFLKDFYMNFKKFVYSDGNIDSQTRAAIGLSVAAHAKSTPWIDYFQTRCESLGFSTQQVAEILAISATNYMYNTFF